MKSGWVWKTASGEEAEEERGFICDRTRTTRWQTNEVRGGQEAGGLYNAEGCAARQRRWLNNAHPQPPTDLALVEWHFNINKESIADGIFAFCSCIRLLSILAINNQSLA